MGKGRKSRLRLASYARSEGKLMAERAGWQFHWDLKGMMVMLMMMMMKWEERIEEEAGQQN